jgi:hypothetical protein
LPPDYPGDDPLPLDGGLGPDDDGTWPDDNIDPGNDQLPPDVMVEEVATVTVDDPYTAPPPIEEAPTFIDVAETGLF